MKFLDHFPNSVFQIFKDRQDAEGYAKVFLEYDEKLFKNLNKKGCGIYFTPNGFKGGRKKENLVRLNAIYADLDVAKEGDKTRDTLERKKRLFKALSEGIMPNFVINTKNGIQPIWLIDEEKTDEETQNRFTRVICGIIEWSKKHGAMGDQVKDVTRVLRLPNYYHMKSDPYLCEVKEFHVNKQALEDLEECYPFQEPVVEKKVVEKKDSATFSEIERLDFQDLIKRAFKETGRIADFDKQNRLVLDGRLTGTFEGKNRGGYLASTSHEPFEGNRITAVADILGVTNKDAYKWIVNEYNINPVEIQKKKKAKNTIEKLKPVEIKKRKSYYTWGTKALTESFAPIKSSTYAVIGSGYGEGKTTFCMHMALENVKLGHKILYISLEMDTEELLDSLARQKARITIPEELHGIPENKTEKYEEARRSLESIENFVLKGVRGGVEINWECLVELMKGEWDMIFIDNFNCIAKNVGTSQYEHEGWLSSKLLSYTQEHQTPLIVVHHYSKGGAREDVKTGYSLSGNAKIMNDSHRIVLIERKKFDDDIPPTAKDLATLKVTLDKARGYDRGVVKIIYFRQGSFYDEFEEIEPPDFGEQFNF